ncbi:SCP-2 sterol transfer family protein [Roseivivax lentus]|uniref:SCP-2 sterol transfer family protein n=1 Tax=Roseivivax lentus TaxID=633194 RepID=A0A1N7JQW0_9RHOB|nr:SCP2 sterol-binding domain-containing protein [Roseivivax lentus]SIS51738.1 SCP-2 sterol transfer family protein [Roseivivax lentus]
MTLEELADMLRPGLTRHPLSESLKFDCGEAGAITLDGAEARVADDPADCTIRISDANLEKLLKGKLNPMTAFAMGKIKVSGDVSVAMKLSKLLG